MQMFLSSTGLKARWNSRRGFFSFGEMWKQGHTDQHPGSASNPLRDWGRAFQGHGSSLRRQRIHPLYQSQVLSRGLRVVPGWQWAILVEILTSQGTGTPKREVRSHWTRVRRNRESTWHALYPMPTPTPGSNCNLPWGFMGPWHTNCAGEFFFFLK